MLRNRPLSPLVLSTLCVASHPGFLVYRHEKPSQLSGSHSSIQCEIYHVCDCSLYPSLTLHLCWVGLCVLRIQLLNSQTLIPRDMAVLKAESLHKVIIQYYRFSCERRKYGHKHTQEGHQRKMNENSDQEQATASREKHGLDSSSGSQKEAAMLTT